MQARVQKARDKTGQHTGQHRERQRQQRVHAHKDQHRARRTSCTKAAVDCKIRNVEQLICDINAQSHNAPDKSLRGRAGDRRDDSTHHSIRPFPYAFLIHRN